MLLNNLFLLCLMMGSCFIVCQSIIWSKSWKDMLNYGGFYTVEQHLLKQLPNDEDPARNLEVAKEMSNNNNNLSNRARKTIEALDLIVTSTGCSDELLDAMEFALMGTRKYYLTRKSYPIKQLKWNSRLFKVFQLSVKKIAPNCPKNFIANFHRLQQNQKWPERVLAFNVAMQNSFDKHGLDLELMAHFIRSRLGTMNEHELVEFVNELAKNDSENEYKDSRNSYQEIISNRSQLINFNSMFERHLVEPCNYFNGIYEPLFEKFGQFLNIKDHFDEKWSDNKPELPNKFIYSLYLYQKCVTVVNLQRNRHFELIINH